jgi:hypothetical protein
VTLIEPKPNNQESQADKFKKLARQIKADEDEVQWEEQLKAIALQKPKDEPEKPQ